VGSRSVGEAGLFFKKGMNMYKKRSYFGITACRLWLSLTGWALLGIGVLIIAIIYFGLAAISADPKLAPPQWISFYIVILTPLFCSPFLVLGILNIAAGQYLRITQDMAQDIHCLFQIKEWEIQQRTRA
jgi:hypothetical protein